MPITVKRLENEPILVATFSGEITVQDIAGMYEESSALIGDSEQRVYRISDVRDATSNFAEMFGVIKLASKGQPGSTSDSRIQVYFVGTSTWINFARSTLKSPVYGGLQIAAFDSIEAALEAIHMQIEMQDQLKTS